MEEPFDVMSDEAIALRNIDAKLEKLCNIFERIAESLEKIQDRGIEIIR